MPSTSINTPLMNLRVFRVLRDNHCFVLWREGSNLALVIDPPEAAPVNRVLCEHGLKLGLILNTHHHADHVGGNLELSAQHGAAIYCSAFDRERIPGASRGLSDGEKLIFDEVAFSALAVPGHTNGHIAFYFSKLRDVLSGSVSGGLFAGDTLFTMGCGRLYEGTAEDMWQSLSHLLSLPRDTRLYFGHEYTELNAPFAMTIEPENAAIAERWQRTKTVLAAHSQAVMPAPTLEQEILVNPFLRVSRPEYRERLGLALEASDREVFRQLRLMRDTFKVC